VVKARRGIAMSSGGSNLAGKALSTGTDRQFTRVHKRATDLWEVRCSCGWSYGAESSYDATRSGQAHSEQMRRMARRAKTKKSADTATSPTTTKKTPSNPAPPASRRIVSSARPPNRLGGTTGGSSVER
jgi:hypothetical protein